MSEKTTEDVRRAMMRNIRTSNAVAAQYREALRRALARGSQKDCEKYRRFAQEESDRAYVWREALYAFNRYFAMKPEA